MAKRGHRKKEGTRKISRKGSKGSKGLQGFDIFHTPIYVINLKERPDRWKLFMEQDPIVKALQIHRINAVNGKLLNYLKDPRISTHTRLNIMRNDRRTHREIATMGAIGCTISHVNIWRKLVASGRPYAVVMEDDARFTMDHLKQIEKVAAAGIPETAQVWLLGMYKPNLIHEPFTATSKWSRVYQFTASHAYLISREAAKKFLEQAFPIEMHVDHYMSAMSSLYDMPIVQNDDIFLPWGGIMKKENETGALESNTSQHRKDGCSACHVPDHLSRFYREVGQKTRKGRIVHGLLREPQPKKVLTYKAVKVDMGALKSSPDKSNE
jgi:GR25 family glycosyltransferase involved in LPS biosynthesis